MKKDKLRIFLLLLPLAFAVVVTIGIFIGMTISSGSLGDISFFDHRVNPADKMNQVLRYIENEYVDTVNKEELVELAISEMLHQLDPHSNYIPAVEFEEVAQSMEGNFEGIGIEFNIIRDTIRVVAVIPGGPSHAVGLLPGDQIIKIGDENVAGIKIKNKDVVSRLRGKKGTTVDVSVKRRGAKKLLSFTIQRGKIPLYSVDVSYMVDKETGYVKLNRFSQTSYDEFMTAVNKLKEKGMKKLIFDLRDNGGGFLEIAVMICNEFLEEGKMIVYTEGRKYKREEKYEKKGGTLKYIGLIILQDENSASASEIVAGAIQDNDRGTIVGRRSFGKGLVQRQSQLSDGSAIRLTTARYYTPTGRCIQKPYNQGYANYLNEEYDRFEKGELLHADSIKFPDSLKFKTPGGKIVYGGGGIMPDIFVPLDTSSRTPYLNQLIYRGIFNQFCFEYADNNRKVLEKEGIESFKQKFVVTDEIVRDLVRSGERTGLPRNEKEISKSLPLIKIYLKAGIARNMWGGDGYYPIFNHQDPAFQKGMEVFKK